MLAEVESAGFWDLMPAPSLLDLGMSALQANRLEEAMALLRQAASQTGDPAAWNLLGLAALRHGDYGQAVAALQAAVRLQPQNPEHHYNLGCALEWAGAAGEAVQAYESAVRTSPGHPQAEARLQFLRGFHQAAPAPTQVGSRQPLQQPYGTGSPAPEPDDFSLPAGFRDWLFAMVQPRRLFEEKSERRGWAGVAAYLTAYSLIFAGCQFLLLSAGGIRLFGLAPGVFAAGSFFGILVGVWIGLLVTGALVHVSSRMLGGQGDFLASFHVAALAQAPYPLIILLAGLIFQASNGRPAADGTARGPALIRLASAQLPPPHYIGPAVPGRQPDFIPPVAPRSGLPPGYPTSPSYPTPPGATPDPGFPVGAPPGATEPNRDLEEIMERLRRTPALEPYGPEPDLTTPRGALPPGSPRLPRGLPGMGLDTDPGAPPAIEPPYGIDPLSQDPQERANAPATHPTPPDADAQRKAMLRAWGLDEWSLGAISGGPATPILQGLWWLVLATLGLVYLHGLSGGRAFTAAILPGLGMFVTACGCVSMLVIIGAMIASGGAR